jgi:hypothetical protein
MKGIIIMKDNTIDIRHLQKADISNGDLQDIITVLECATSHLLLPDEAVLALERLRKAVKG